LYNAHGRSIHSDHSSATLRKFILSISPYSKNINTTFDISKYIVDFSKKQILLYRKHFEEYYYKYITDQISLEILITKWNNLTDKCKHEHIQDICNSIRGSLFKNFKYFDYIRFYLNEYNNNNITNLNDVVLEYIFSILNTNIYITSDHTYLNKISIKSPYKYIFFANKDECILFAIDIFIKLFNYNEQSEIVEQLLITDKLNFDNSIELLKLIGIQDDLNKYNIKYIFNNFFDNDIIDVLKRFIKTKSFYKSFSLFKNKIKKLILNKIPSRFVWDTTNNFHINYNKFINYLKELDNNDGYILYHKLLNALRWCNDQYPNDCENIRCEEFGCRYCSIEHEISKFDCLEVTFIDGQFHSKNICRRIYNDLQYIKIKKNIYNKIFSNVIYDYNRDMNSFRIIDLDELYYYYGDE
jgi:hypothetical protein